VATVVGNSKRYALFGLLGGKEQGKRLQAPMFQDMEAL